MSSLKMCALVNFDPSLYYTLLIILTTKGEIEDPMWAVRKFK